MDNLLSPQLVELVVAIIVIVVQVLVAILYPTLIYKKYKNKTQYSIRMKFLLTLIIACVFWLVYVYLERFLYDSKYEEWSSSVPGELIIYDLCTGHFVQNIAEKAGNIPHNCLSYNQITRTIKWKNITYLRSSLPSL